MPKPAPPTPFADLPEATRRGIRTLAASAPAKALAQRDASAKSLRSASLRYIAAAQKLGLPPELWRVECSEDGFGSEPDALRPPLPFLSFNRAGASASASLAAEAFLLAGCSLWTGDWLIPPRGPRFHLEPRSTAEYAQYALSPQDPGAQSAILRQALADPSTPRAFVVDLRSRLNHILSASTDGPGVWSDSDALAMAACSILSDCSAELLESSARRLWATDAMAAKARKILALKRLPDPFGLPALQTLFTPERQKRLRALSGLACDFPLDDGLLQAAFDATPWLSESPSFACLSPEHGPSLFQAALSSASPFALRWLSMAGANIWLASAQLGRPNAAQWAIGHIHSDASPEAIESLALSLRSGAMALGGPASRSLRALARKTTAEASSHPYPEIQRLGQRLGSAMEALEIEASAPSRQPSPRPGAARRL